MRSIVLHHPASRRWGAPLLWAWQRKMWSMGLVIRDITGWLTPVSYTCIYLFTAHTCTCICWKLNIHICSCLCLGAYVHTYMQEFISPAKLVTPLRGAYELLVCVHCKSRTYMYMYICTLYIYWVVTSHSYSLLMWATYALKCWTLGENVK